MVDRSLYDSYRKALSNLSDAAERRLEALMQQIGSLESDGDYVRATVLYSKVVTEYGQVAADAAREFYQTQRDMSDLDTEYTATQGQAIPSAYMTGDVAEARHGGMSPAEAYAWLLAKGSQRILDHADYVIGFNAKLDPAHPKWAIVPGPLACGFCVMVASNGWYMSSRPAKVERHPHCKCHAVADFDTENPALEGYDPEAMRDAYAMAEDTVHDYVNQRWNSMTPEERSRYKRNGKVSKDKFKTEQVVAEMDRRDREWLQNPSNHPKFEVMKGAHPSTKEKDFADALSVYGWKSVFRPVRDGADDPKRTSDVFFKSGTEEIGFTFTPVEFKQPSGSGRQTVFHQFEYAAGQARWLAIDTRGMGSDISDAEILESASRCIGRTFSVKTGKMKGTPWDFDRVTLLMRDGSTADFFR